MGKPIYIIPRKRIVIKDGKSVSGEVCNVKTIEEYIIKIAKNIEFIGAINFQAFVNLCGDVSFIEVNPRLGGGTALSFAASENWVNLMISNLVLNQPIKAKPIKYGLKMSRSYSEVYFF